MKGQFPWIGRSRGSAGGMTTCKINDKNVMRAKAFDVTNPNTPAQQMQRDFFKQVQEVCASVTEDQLRSLFGIKPKSMTRRNALSKQIAAAYTITNSIKSVDFSKLDAIGNGEKVTTTIFEITEEGVEDQTPITREQLGITEAQTPNIIVVIFDTENKRIIIENLENTYDDSISPYVVYDFVEFTGVGYAYITCATNGSNVFDQQFGSFTIKTRATD